MHVFICLVQDVTIRVVIGGNEAKRINIERVNLFRIPTESTKIRGEDSGYICLMINAQIREGEEIKAIVKKKKLIHFNKTKLNKNHYHYRRAIISNNG